MILVTGAHGFVAGRLVRRLAERGYDVRALVRRPHPVDGAELVVGDLAETEVVRRAVAGAGAVVHAAASFSDDFDEARRVNVDATEALARAAREAGCRRFVHLSTCGAYDLTGRDVVDEETPLWPYERSSPRVYGVTKAEGDRVVRRVAAAGLSTVVLRFPNVLGAGVDNFFAYELPLRIREGKATQAGDGHNTWPVVHVENLVDGILLALELPEATGQPYTLVDHHTTWGEFAGRIAGWLGAEVRRREAESIYDRFTGRFSTERARRELGYVPRLGYEDAMREARLFLADQGVL